MLALILAVLLVAPAEASTPEAAAATLLAAGKLHCHRNFEAAGWEATGTDLGAGGQGWRETDQDLNDQRICGKRFTVGGENGSDVWIQSWTPSVVTGLNNLSALGLQTSSGSIGGNAGSLFVGSAVGSEDWQTGDLTGRIGWRYYVKWSGGATPEACRQAKIVQVGDYWSYQVDATIPQDDGGLLWHGAGEAVPNHTASDRDEKWWRIEEYWDAHTGGGGTPTTTTMIVKNITDDGPELSRTVTSGMALVISNMNGSTSHWIHEHQDQRSFPGTCNYTFMYLLVGKNLGASERIPAAEEVEGEAPPSRGANRLLLIRTLVPFLLVGGVIAGRLYARAR